MGGVLHSESWIARGANEAVHATMTHQTHEKRGSLCLVVKSLDSGRRSEY